MNTIHLIEGPVGAGKSTFALRLAHELRAPRLDLDEWMTTLFRPDRPDGDIRRWYLERKERCIEQIWQVGAELLGAGSDVVLELGLVQRSDRMAFYGRVDASNVPLVVYLLDAPEPVRRSRVRERNVQRGDTFKMEVSDEIFAIANGAWEAPDDDEIEARGIRVVASG